MGRGSSRSPSLFLPGRQLRTWDALHLATALRVGADAVVAYDARLLAAARTLGMSVQSPS